jgi:hypothetical protein
MLAGGYCPQRPEFNPRRIRMGFVAKEKSVFGHIFFKTFRISPVNYNFPDTPYTLLPYGFSTGVPEEAITRKRSHPTREENNYV